MANDKTTIPEKRAEHKAAMAKEKAKRQKALTLAKAKSQSNLAVAKAKARVKAKADRKIIESGRTEAIEKRVKAQKIAFARRQSQKALR